MVQIIFTQICQHLCFTWNVRHTVLLHEIWHVWCAIFLMACFQWRYELLCISQSFICNWLSYMQCGILSVTHILFHSPDNEYVIKEMSTFAQFSYGNQATEKVWGHMEYPYLRYKCLSATLMHEICNCLYFKWGHHTTDSLLWNTLPRSKLDTGFSLYDKPGATCPIWIAEVDSPTWNVECPESPYENIWVCI